MAEPKIPRPRTAQGEFGTTRGTLYTAPPNSRAETVSLGFTSTAGASPTINVELFRSSDSTRVYLYNGYGTFPTHTDEIKLVLSAGDRIEVTAVGSGSSVHAYVTVNEVFVPVG